MAIVLPPEYEPVTLEALTGVVPAGIDPVDQLGQATNFLYAEHSPPLLNACPVQSAAQATQRFVFPVVPSADGLSYLFAVNTWSSGAATVTLTIETSASNSTGAWSALTSAVRNPSTANEWWTTTATLAASVRFLRVTLASAAYCQLQSLMVYPAQIATIPAAAQPSGFVAWDSGAINDAGAAIHTEYLNRIKTNVLATVASRRHCLLSWAGPDNYTSPYRFSAGSGVSARRILYTPSSVIGQRGATVTVRCRAADAGTGSVTVGVVGGEAVNLTADDTDRSDTLTLHTDRPIWYATANVGTLVTVYYITADWAPGD